MTVQRVILRTFVIVVLILMITQPVLAAARIIGGAIVETNDTGAAKTDFHIEVSSDTNMNCVGEDLGGDLQVNGGAWQKPTVQNNNTHKVTLTWDVAIPVGAEVVAGFACTQEEKNKFSVNAFFTPRNSPTDIPTLGWRVTASGDVFLTNSYSSTVAFQDLWVQFPSEITLDSMFELVSGSSIGVPASVPSGTVPAGSPSDPGELLVDQFSLNPGDFLTARLDTSFTDPGFSNLDATIAIGHEHQEVFSTCLPVILR